MLKGFNITKQYNLCAEKLEEIAVFDDFLVMEKI